MRTTRRFLLAPSLARLIEKEREGHHVTEGYFPEQGGQSVFARVDENMGLLALTTIGSNVLPEEHVDLPRSQAQFLIDSTTIRVNYRQIDLSIGTQTVQISRFFGPVSLDMISVEFEREEEASGFQPLPWFGPDVTADARYRNRSIAIAELRETPEVEISNDALNSLLDSLESQSSLWHSPDLTPTTTSSKAQQSEEELSASEPDRDEDGLGIEDDVIRELASALRPQRR